MLKICRHNYRKGDGVHCGPLTPDQSHTILLVILLIIWPNKLQVASRLLTKARSRHPYPNLNAIAQHNAQLSKITSTRVRFERSIKSLLTNLLLFSRLMSNHMTQYVNYRIKLCFKLCTISLMLKLIIQRKLGREHYKDHGHSGRAKSTINQTFIPN